MTAADGAEGTTAGMQPAPEALAKLIATLSSL